MKRHSRHVREQENYEHILMCLICRSLFDDGDHQPKFLPCHHTFCKDCLREYVKRMGDDIECPSCRKVTTIPAAGVTALQTNFYVKYIQGLVQHGSYVGNGGNRKCSAHSDETVEYYCKDCETCVCSKCCLVEGSACAGHNKVPITTITEECHNKLDKSFTRVNSLIEHKRVESESLLKALSDEKDEALKKIDSTMEAHAHTLHRRGTLLKNKVIDIYNEHVGQLETDLEDISTAMTCIVSLKEYHEQLIGQALCHDIDRGVADLDDVFHNISVKISPGENHIVYEDKHGVDKFRMAAKDLGRVRNSPPTVPRSEPEGGRDGPVKSVVTPPLTPSDHSETSPATATTIGNRMSLVGAETPAVEVSGGVTSQQTAGYCNTEVNNSDAANANSTAALNITNNPIITTSTTTTEQFDNNLNTTKCPATRPKCFDMTKRKNKTSNAKTKIPSSKAQQSTRHLDDTSSRSKQTLVPTLKLYDRFKDETLTLPDLDALKKTDKMYHHLVYTSYDEDELLKELKCGKYTLADPSLVHLEADSSCWGVGQTIEEVDSTPSDNSMSLQ